MIKKLVPAIVIVLVVLGGVYKFVLAKPAAAEPKPKVTGKVYLLGKEFLINLADGRFVKLQVGLLLAEDDTSAEPASAEAATPPEGYGAMAQEGVVRDLISDTLTGAKDSQLIDRRGRKALKETILKGIKKHTDVKVEDILFTDVTIQ